MHDPDLELWRRILVPESASLRAAAAALDPTDVTAVARLRRRYAADELALAIELARARQKAVVKFGDVAAQLIGDVAGVEQASGAVVAAHKAERFGDAGGAVHDLCCGIGGDTMALARVGPVTAIDVRPVRAWMAGMNASCPSDAADVETLDLGTIDCFHIDPARRDEATGRRHRRDVDLVPGPDFLARLRAAVPDGAVKLGPGVELEAWEGDATEVEVIAEGRRLVQAVQWCGRLARAPGARTATVLPDGPRVTGTPGAPPSADAAQPFGRWLYVPHPALERTGLVGSALAGRPVREVHPGLGLLTGDTYIDDPWLEAREVLEVLPWRLERVRSVVRAHDAGTVIVRTRGGAVDPDPLARALSGPGQEPLAVFVLRLGVRKLAVVTR